jgi:hypothetical protein
MKPVRLFTCLALIAGALTVGACGGGSSGAGSGQGAGSSGAGGHGGTSSGAPPITPTDVTTYHNDPMRTGQNLTESALTSDTVSASSFGLLAILPTDGVVDATPLIVSNLSIDGTTHTVAYVVSENDSVYAYDLNGLTLLKQVSLLGTGETAASITGGCNQVTPKIGITATPAIDRSAGPNGTLFVVAMSQDAGGNTVHRLHALDLTTLADLEPAVNIQASYSGSGPNASNGTLNFDPRQYKERSALLLSGGQIYTSWASNCDIDPYNGWIIAYSESSLTRTQVFNLTPNGSRGAIWNTGGLLSDEAGSLYALLANGTFDSQQDYGNAAVRLTTTGAALTVADYFTPTNTASESASDLDLGSGSPMLIPNQLDATGATRQLMFAAGKDGIVFLLDRTHMGQFNANVNQVYQQVALSHALFSAPAYFSGSLYVGAVGAPLQAFALQDAQIPTSPSSQSAASFAYPGTSPSISANGSSNGIVWAVESNPGAAAVLHAYSPANLAQEYYNSTQAGSRDGFGNGNKFVTPVIADGRVLIGTPDGVAVFGLL